MAVVRRLPGIGKIDSFLDIGFEIYDVGFFCPELALLMMTHRSKKNEVYLFEP